MKKLINIVGLYRKADPALAITLQFVVFGMFWILFSDTVLFMLGPENMLWKLAHIHILKGLLFVGVTGAFIFYWTNFYAYSLKQKETEMSNIFQTSPLPMGIVDSSSFKLLEANEVLLNLFGHSRAEILSLTLEDLSAEKERYEALPLMIRTGSRDLGVWKQVKKNGEFFSVKFSAQSVRDRKAFLLLFADVTTEVEIKGELQRIRHAFEDRLNAKVDYLTRINEELAYRASQTEHVNTELISVNERLQMVNKKIATQAEESLWKNKALNEILSTNLDVVWSFDLSTKNRNYISPSAELVFEDPIAKMDNAWFWMEYIHPEDEALKDLNRGYILDKSESSSVFRILSRKGTIRYMYIRIKLVRDQAKGTATLMGIATDVSGLNLENRIPVMIPRSGLRY